MLYAFLRLPRRAHKKLGKLVVVGRDADVPMLEKLYARRHGTASRISACWTALAAIRMEPALACVAAFHSPETGIIDSHRYMLACKVTWRMPAAFWRLNTPVEDYALTPAAGKVRFGGTEAWIALVDAVVNSAGHGAQKLARATEGYPADRVPRLVLAKGTYFSYRGARHSAGSSYPAPVPGGSAFTSRSISPAACGLVLTCSGRLLRLRRRSPTGHDVLSAIRPTGRALRTACWFRTTRYSTEADRPGRARRELS